MSSYYSLSKYAKALSSWTFALSLLTLVGFSNEVRAEERPMVLSPDTELVEPLMPSEWMSNILMPSITGDLVVISSGPAATEGNTNLVVRYTVKNNGEEPLNSVQLSLDLMDQLGSTFIGLNGPLTTLTGSGGMLTASGSNIFGGSVNVLYNGSSIDEIFTPGMNPSLDPDECIAIDIPIEIGPNPGLGPVSITGSSSAMTSMGGSVAFITAPTNVLPGCQSESLACAGRVNITLDSTCIGVVTLNTVFLNRDKDPLRYRVVVFEDGVAIGDTVNDSHVGKELTFSVLDGCFNDRVGCWGVLNVENKRIPDPIVNCAEYVCGQDYNDLLPLNDVLDLLDVGCIPPFTNVTEEYNTEGDKCIGYVTTRSILADLDLGSGGKIRVPLYIDSIKESPIDTNDINGPIGGPLFEDAIYIDCNVASAHELTPDFIADYFDGLPATTGSGTAYGYPWIDRGAKITSSQMVMDSVREYVVEDSSIVIDGVTYIYDVVVKDTIEYAITKYDTIPNLIRLKKGNICNLSVKCTDSYFEGCAGDSAKLLREWTVLNWCSGDLQYFDQWIVLEDRTPPAIKPIDDLQAQLVPWDCSAEVQLEAEVWDDCSDVLRDSWATSAGRITEDGMLVDIFLGDSPITVSYTATDGCGNDSTFIFQVHVIDNVKPVAIAEDVINVSLVFDPVELMPVVKVFKESIDAGSHDSDCGSISTCVLLDSELQSPIFDRFGNQATDDDGNLLYEAHQCLNDGIYLDSIAVDKDQYIVSETPYVICKDYVKFCCSDVGTHKVALVADDGSPYSQFGVSWTDVIVEDKTTTIFRCDPITVECGDDYSVEGLGEPDVIFGICMGGELTHIDIEDIDGCGEGRITRQWYLDGELRCEQPIIIGGATAFDPYSIKWPIHYDDSTVDGIRRECEDDTMRYQTVLIDMAESFTCDGDSISEPVWCQSDCGLLAMSYEDTDVEADGACRKIIRKWTIIDWCNYTPNGNNTDEDASDSFVAFDDVWLGPGFWKAETDPNEPCELCEHPEGADTRVYFRYQNVDVDGYYTYDQVIKIHDDTPPEIDAPVFVDVDIWEGATSKDEGYEDCVADSTITASVVELCGNVVLDAGAVTWTIEVYNEDGDLLRSKTSRGEIATMNSQPGGSLDIHTIKWFVSDGCGNDASAETQVRFRDRKNPTPVCLATVSTATMNVSNGAAQIWAEDFDRGSYDNCSPVKVFFRNEAGFDVNSLTFTCDDIPNGVVAMKELRMYASDESGNEDFCYVTIRIDDTNNVCDDADVEDAAIQGVIATDKGETVEEAVVQIGVQQTVTDVQGVYAFETNELYSSYRISPSKDDFPLNGVSTLDLLLIQRHILALSRLDTPYKVIAADINSDQRVSSIDLVQLRSLLLGITLDFPDNDSWRFVDPEQTWANDLDPFPFTEEIIIENLNDNMVDQNFLGVKIGDVSGNAIPNSLLGDIRSVGEVTLMIQDQWMHEGETVEVPVTIESAKTLFGFQMTLQTDEAIINGIGSAQMQVSSEDYKVHDRDQLTMAWFDIDGQAVENEIIMISITALSDGLLSEKLEMSSEITPAKAYEEDLEELSLALEFSTAENLAGGVLKLSQNLPNPFSESTTIGFNLPEAGLAILTITDVTGKQVYEASANYGSGSHQITLTRDDVRTSGLLYYQLKFGDKELSRKMIVVE